MPPEIEALRWVDRFGAQAVFGRTLSRGELRRMALAENIVRAFEARQKSANWAAWEIEHPDEADLLKECERLAEEM
jgi:hypothetical protein